MNKLRASREPLEAIKKITYPGQPEHMRRYRPGYEEFFNRMPVLTPDEEELNAAVQRTRETVQALALQVRGDQHFHQDNPGTGNFSRTILAIEEPEQPAFGGPYKEGTELVVASWGDGFTSPVHGHAPGYLHEEILFGKMRVNIYRIVGPKLVRPYKTEIVTEGTFATLYTDPNAADGRTALVHNFTSIGFSASLHYLPEHTRDGRDNRYEVEYFEDVNPLSVDDVKQITSKEGLYSRVGDVIMVRSSNVPEYGDHFIVITGHPVLKEHGLRPQDVALPASPNGYSLLDFYDSYDGLVLLKLKSEARDKFLAFHGITIKDQNVIFPTI